MSGASPPRSGSFYIRDIVRERKAPGAIEQLVAATAARDGREVAVRIEQEPGASGKALAERYKRQVLRDYIVRSERVTGAKDVRARPVAAAAANGLVAIIASTRWPAPTTTSAAIAAGR